MQLLHESGLNSLSKKVVSISANLLSSSEASSTQTWLAAPYADWSHTNTRVSGPIRGWLFTIPDWFRSQFGVCVVSKPSESQRCFLFYTLSNWPHQYNMRFLFEKLDPHVCTNLTYYNLFNLKSHHSELNTGLWWLASGVRATYAFSSYVVKA